MILWVVFFLTIASCTENEWEVKTEIYPRILEISEDRTIVSIQYFVGSLEFLDDLTNVKRAIVNKLEENKNDLTLILYVHHDRFFSENTTFDYYMKNGVLIHSSSGMNYGRLQRNHTKIPGFKWIIRDHKAVEEVEEPATEIKEPKINQEVDKTL